MRISLIKGVLLQQSRIKRRDVILRRGIGHTYFICMTHRIQ